MNILITGGTSFIASHLITKLISDSEINKIYIVTRRINDFILKISLFEKIEIIELVFDEYGKYFKDANLRIDVVFHFT